MRFRSSSHVRVKIVALLAALAALWAFAAWVTVRDGLNLLFVNTLANDAGISTEELVEALQQERRLSAVALGAAGPDARQALAESRAHTDEVREQWQREVSSRALSLAAGDRTEALIDDLSGQVSELGALREEIDAAAVDRGQANAAYTGIIDAGFAIYSSLGSLDDLEIARQSQLLTSLTQARELLSRQDSLLAGALATGELSADEITELTMLVGAQRQLYQRTAAELPADDRALYQQALETPAMTELRQAEDTLLSQARPGESPPLTAQDWDDISHAAVATMRDVELAAVDNLLERATPVAVGVVVRLLLAGGLGLVALVAAVVISITTARNLVRQLERLRDAARDLATNRLPRVVERLSVGETVDVTAEAPPLRFGRDEIGQVGQAFNAVQETAIQAAVQQAELRRGVRDIFLSLARRTQGLVHKQLGVLDTVERRVTDADEMEELFRIDHLATRMRRNAENLIVLSGASSGRAWRHPVPMVDVIRGALAEVEDYTRVNLLPVEAGALEGRVVGDVIHLLAELIENAASFSPPYASVTVSGQRVAHGFVVEVEDRGLGMTEEELAAVNERLADPPDFSLADASRLGHYVVAKLAQRHGIKVHLRASPYGGVAAIVLIPGDLVVEQDRELPYAGTTGPAGADGRGRAIAGAAGGRSNGAAEPPRHAALVVRQRREPAPGPGGAAPAGALGAPTQGAPTQGAPAQGAPAHGAPTQGAAANATPLADDGQDDGQDAGQQGAAPLARTPSGLPWRVRQASLPRQLRDEAVEQEQTARDPEQVRRMMQAYQRGTQLGRSETGPGGQPAPRGGDSQEG